VPRHTHPVPSARHSRAHIRYQRERWIERRWRQAKDRYAYGWSSRPWRAAPYIHPEQARELHVASGDRWPSTWPFAKPRNQFARNLFTLCSCGICQLEEPGERARARRLWREDVARDLAEED
jgi:hypothetical protein